MGNQTSQDSIQYVPVNQQEDNSQAQYRLGLLYYKGQDVEKDWKKASHYWQLSANEGHSGAHYYLGLIYRNGQGVETEGYPMIPPSIG